MITTELLKSKFQQGLKYDDYVNMGNAEQRKRWRAAEPLMQVSDIDKTLLGGFTRAMPVLCISGIWCGDCVQQCPMLNVVAASNSQAIDLRFLERDAHKDLADLFRINAGLRVPTVIFMAEDFEFCGLAGDRTISRYRAIARAKLGASCPTGLQPPDKSELDDTIHDWVTEFERVQLMLRLSPRLRQIHND